MWIKTSESKPLGPCIAFDAVGMSTGIWDGSRFDSFQGAYSFDDEYSVPHSMVFLDYSQMRCCGAITHWMPLPTPPTAEECGEVKHILQQAQTEAPRKCMVCGEVVGKFGQCGCNRLYA